MNLLRNRLITELLELAGKYFASDDFLVFFFFAEAEATEALSRDVEKDDGK